MTRRPHFLTLLCLIPLWTSAQSLLDPNFAQSGRFTIDVDSIDHCETLLTDQEANVYFLGYTGNGDDMDYLIGKVDSSGNLVTSFGNQGIIRADQGPWQNSRIRDAGILDSAIYFCGNNGEPGTMDTQQVFVGKMDLYGNIDMTYGVNGFYSDTFVSGYNDIRSMYVLDDHRVIIAGVTFDSLVQHREIVFFGRLKANGERDSAFGGTGVRTWNTADGLNNGLHKPNGNRHVDGTVINAICPDGWGGYFGAGYFDNGQSFSILTINFDTLGNLNPNYGNNGALVYSFDPTARLQVMDALPFDGEIVMAIKPGVNGDFVVQTVSSIGQLGTPQYIDAHGDHDRMEDMTIDSQGQLYFCGSSTLNANLAVHQGNYFTAFRAQPQTTQLDVHFADSAFFKEEFTSDPEAAAYSICPSVAGMYLGGLVGNLDPSDRSDIGIMRFDLSPSFLSVREQHNEQLHAYPNPTTGIINITGINPKDEVKVFSVDGALVGSRLGNGEVDLSGLAKGPYVLRIENKKRPRRALIILGE